ncbi:MAG: epoxide hydrolase family protein [Acidimicrobiales bacterium]
MDSLPAQPGAAQALQPFRITITDAELADLRERLHDARLPDQIPGTGWDFGTDMAYLRELVDYWADQYDWRAQEARINAFDQYTTTIDGENVHFIHARSPEPDALPLILTHGWPGSIVEFLDVIEPLRNPRAHGGEPRDAFHVVVPSLPGYAFSGPTKAAGWSVRRIAQAWAVLMQRLDYDRYGAQGGDWGSFVSRHLADVDREHVCGIHVNMWTAAASGAPGEMDGLTERELAHLARAADYFKTGSGYVAIQSTRPQTLAYGLNDSPAGLLSWIVEKFYAWTDNNGSVEDAVSRDALLTNVALYWFTGTAGSAARLYYESITSGAVVPPPITHIPVGVGDYPQEIIAAPRRWVERDNNVIHWSDMPRGGHFAAMEEPDLFVDDVRSFFRKVRA